MTDDFYHCKELLKTDKDFRYLLNQITEISNMYQLPLVVDAYNLSVLYRNHKYIETESMEYFKNKVYCKVNEGIETMIKQYSLKGE